MILAGDIGGTNARLALFDVRNGKFNLVTATIFPSRNYSGLDQIVTEFVATSGVHPAQACFGVAGPGSERQLELFGYLHARYGHVSYERVLSGPGLVNIFEFLRDTGRGKVPGWLSAEMKVMDPAAAISAAAMDAKCPMSEQAMDIFVSIFGAEAGNLGLKIKATGGVFLAGGIAPKILAKLATPLFLDAFLSKGRLRHLMEVMPVNVIINDKLALLGAARCALMETAA